MIAKSSPDRADAMATKKAIVYFTCPHEIKDKLQAWAEAEGRSLSNLMERIAIAAVDQSEKSKEE